MTNRELLNLPPPLLSERDKQRLFLLRIQATARPGPACHKAVVAVPPSTRSTGDGGTAGLLEG